jgi:transcriptional regulator with XRE-family HTH domain
MYCFKENLKFLRELRKLSIAQMADLLKLKPSRWGNYETGESQPNLDVFVYIAKFFGVEETDLLHTDLSKNVHLIGNIEEIKNTENVQAIVHPIVQPNGTSNKIGASKERAKGAQKGDVDEFVTNSVYRAEMQYIKGIQSSFEARLKKIEDQISKFIKGK